MSVSAITRGTNGGEPAEVRRHWLAVLAKADEADLERAWTALDSPPGYRTLRPPETGLVMVRGRIGGTGAQFNLGEMTMTRAAVQLLDDSGEPLLTGFGHVAGRSRRRAELVALFDAMLQDPVRHDSLSATVVEPLAAQQQAARSHGAAKTAATKVEFFTLVRGE